MGVIQDIKERSLFLTDTEDGKVDVYLELNDYEQLIKLAEKTERYERAFEGRRVCDHCNGVIRNMIDDSE